jgi:hypothetical protein
MIGGGFRRRWNTAIRRVAWGRRLEIGLTLVAWVGRVWLSHVFGHIAAFGVIAVGAGALVCVPRSRAWLLDHTRSEMIERWFSKALAHAGIRSFDSGIQIAESRTVPGGVCLSVLVPEGTTVDPLANGSEALAVTLRAREIRVVRDPAIAGRADITVLCGDPLDAPEVRWPWANAWQTLLWQGLPLGVDEQGRNVQLDLAGRNLIVGGVSGSGKTNALALVVGAAALDPNVSMWLLDGERRELARWRHSATRYIRSDVTKATEALDKLRALVTDRHETLKSQKLAKVTPDMGIDLIVVVIDELDFYLRKSYEQSAFAEALLDVLDRGRAAGVIVVAATANQTTIAIPTTMDDYFELRLALRCANRQESDHLLRSAWPPISVSADDIGADSPGVGLMLTDRGVPTKLRCYHVGDDDIDATAERAAQLRDSRPRKQSAD